MDVTVVWLPVSSIDRAVEFYRDRLGLELEQQDGAWAMLRAGAVQIGLNARESPSGDGGAVPAFAAGPDIDGALGRLREGGVEITAEVSEHPWGRIATFRDPDGNDLQLYAPPAS